MSAAGSGIGKSRAAGLLAEREQTYLAELRRLIDAAYTVAARTGTVEPRVADIVSEAGLSNVAFYRHFASKDELMLAVLEDGRQRLVDYLDHVMSRTDDPVERIELWVAAVLAQAQDAEAASRTRPFALQADRLGALFPEAQTRSIDAIRAPLAEAVDSAVRAGSLQASATERIDLVFWFAFGALDRHLVAETVPDREEVRRVTAFCLGGLGVTPAE